MRENNGFRIIFMVFNYIGEDDNFVFGYVEFEGSIGLFCVDCS